MADDRCKLSVSCTDPTWCRDNGECARQSRAAPPLSVQEPEPVAWRPKLGIADATWNAGAPSLRDIEYWDREGAGIEYAYAAPDSALATCKEGLQVSGEPFGNSEQLPPGVEDSSLSSMLEYAKGYRDGKAFALQMLRPSTAVVSELKNRRPDSALLALLAETQEEYDRTGRVVKSMKRIRSVLAQHKGAAT